MSILCRNSAVIHSKALSQMLHILSNKMVITRAFCKTPPTSPSAPCCMSGCANCVWIDYAEEVIKFYVERGGNVPKADLISDLETKIDDPIIKTFVLIEVKRKLGIS